MMLLLLMFQHRAFKKIYENAVFIRVKNGGGGILAGVGNVLNEHFSCVGYTFGYDRIVHWLSDYSDCTNTFCVCILI